MSSFFIPTSWGNLVDAMKFRSKVSLGPSTSDKKPTVKTKLKKNIKKTVRDEASTLTAATISKTKSIDKRNDQKMKAKPNQVLNGRIVKEISNKKSSLKVPMASTALSRGGGGSVTKLKTNKKSRQRNLQKKRTSGGDGVGAALSSDSKSNTSMASAKVELTTSPTTDDITIDTSGPQALTDFGDIGLKVFEHSLKQQLLAGRFRFINEQLYTMDSAEAEEMFKTDADAFDAYHAGYQQQVEKWPMNPLDRIIKMIRRLPKTLDIADFGCGEGRLAKSVANKVYSMDLLSTRSDIIACDMARTPLNDQSVDIAVYCLSLMGTNLKDYLLEANRVLRMSGLVLIAEIQSRFDDLNKFIRGLQACGFELVKKDVNDKLFYFFQFKKVRNVGKVAIITPFTLKPCLYRKR